LKSTSWTLIEQELMQMPENRRSMVKGLLERVKNHVLPAVSMQGLGMRKSWEKDVLLTPFESW